MPNPRFDILMCDDIRVENTGKLLIIGAYIDGFVAPLPSEYFLSFLIRMSEFEVGEHKIRFFSTAPSNSNFDTTGTVIIRDTKKPVSISFRDIAFEFTKPGLLVLNAQVDKEDPIEVFSIQISKPATPPEKTDT